MKGWNILSLRLMLFIHFIFTSIDAFSFALLPVMQRLNPRRHQHIYNNYHDTKRAATTTTNSSDNDKDALNTNTKEMTLDQKDFFMGYINQHHSDVLCDFVIAFTDLGALMRRKNSFSGGSMSIDGAKLVQLTAKEFEVKILVHERSKESLIKMVRIPWDADLHKDSLKRMYRLLREKVPKTENYDPVDDPIRRMVRLLHIVKRPEVTGKLCQLGIQIGQRKRARIEENLYLNNVPHNRPLRKYFYDMACQAALESVVLCSAGKLTNRMQICCSIPELNPGMDAYRVGTLLEMTRAIAITLVEQNLRVRVCVQGSMGSGIFTAIPKQLSGVATLLQRMDWQSGEGEDNEGMIGDYINFGGIGAKHVVNTGVDRRGNPIEQDDVFLIVCPQSMVGTDTSIYGPLLEHVRAAGDRPCILINPDLTDKISAAGQQSVRGRSERMAFEQSFSTIYQFQCTYVSGTSYFPILGALAKFGPTEPWISYQRRDRVNNGGEVYIPVVMDEEIPDNEIIMKAMSL